MSKMNEQEYLKQRLDDQIDWYDKKSMFNQKWFKRLRNIELLLSALIPFLVGYIPQYNFLALCVGVIGVIITFITGALSLYKFQENWIEYRTVCETLKHEKFMYLTSSGIYATTENPFLLLVERVESIISHENSNWTQLQRGSNKQPPLLSHTNSSASSIGS